MNVERVTLEVMELIASRGEIITFREEVSATEAGQRESEIIAQNDAFCLANDTTHTTFVRRIAHLV